ncbi:MAG: hypothetical protein OQL19_13870 [Gammaproteobacteria bacterium]|nr:hypothetical protein [Gammaproteobacteria bacterium]
MKNYGFILLISLLALIQTSVLSANDSSSDNINPFLKLIPAETILFSGNTQLLNLDDYPLFSLGQSFNTPLDQSERDAMGKELSFLYELYMDLEATALQGNSFLQSHYGLPKNIAFALYTIGVSPVLKISLENEQAFLDVLSQAEKKSGFEHQNGDFESQKYWFYPIGNEHQLIVAIQKIDEDKKLATLALLSNTSSDTHKKSVLGLTLPEQSIEDKVTKIQNDNQYLPLSISFIDFKALVKSLFKPTNLTAEAQAEKNPWLELFGDQEAFILGLQASNCENDFMSLVQEMPQLIAGYKKYQVEGQRVIMDFEALLELKNHNVKTELDRFRGFIPNYISNGAQDNILALGMGVNLSQISPFFIYVTQAVRESTFQCEQLKEIQKNIAQMNPLMLAMVTGVVDGVHGIGFALQNFSMVETDENSDNQSSNSNGMVQEASKKFEVSSLISLSADNPLKVWQMMAAFVPQIALIIPSETPQKLNFPELDAMNLEVFIATKGQHLVLYSGQQAEEMSRSLLDEKMVVNGFFQETLNYTHLTKALTDVRHMLSQPENNQELLPVEACIYFDETLNIMSRLSGFIDYKSDFIDRGWLNLLNADIELNPALKYDYQLAGKYETYYIKDGCQLGKDGIEEVLEDGTGFYQQYSDDGQCFIFETRYRWTQLSEAMNLQYVSERSRPEGVCANEFDAWAIPAPEYVNDTCQLRNDSEGAFSCLYQWDDEMTKSVYKRI